MSTEPQSLTEAARRGADAVSRALQAGADPNARDTDDWSALDHAAGAGDVEAVRLLLDAGADPTAMGREQRTAYEIALAAGRREAAVVLRQAEENADPESAQRHVWQPYTRAYLLADLRRFPGWTETPQAEPLTDETVVFMHPDHGVTTSIWPDQNVVYTSDSPEWTAFCRDELRFTVPDDFDLMP